MLPKAISVFEVSLLLSVPKCRVGPTAVAPMMHSSGPLLLPNTCDTGIKESTLHSVNRAQSPMLCDTVTQH